MYTLYGSVKSRAGRVVWMLEELGVPYEIRSVAPHSPEVLAVNPQGKIPVLADGDLVLTDSAAILMHLADKHGAMTYPVGSGERARLMSCVCFALDELEQPLWTVAKHGFVLPEALRKPEAVAPACHHEWRTGLANLEVRLGDGPFLMGEDFTIADIIVGHIGGWAKGAGFPAPEGAVAEYMARVRSRDGWKAVVKAREAA